MATRSTCTRKETAIALLARAADRHCTAGSSGPHFRRLRPRAEIVAATSDVPTTLEASERSPPSSSRRATCWSSNRRTIYTSCATRSKSRRPACPPLDRRARHQRRRLDDGGQSTVDGLREFLDHNPDWFVFRHASHQHGLTVLGCQAADRPAEPVIFTPGFGPGTELKAVWPV